MKSSKIAFAILAMAISIVACQSVDFKKASSGIPYKIFSSSKGDSVKIGSVVKYEVIQKVKDSVLFSSYVNKTPFYFEVKPQTEKPNYSNIRATAEGLIAKTKEGDSIYLVQATDSIIKQNPEQAIYKKGQQVITTIRVEKVFKNVDEANADYMKQQAVSYEENKKQGLANLKKDANAQASIQKDDKVIEDYLKTHHIQAQKNEWGIYVEVLTPGQGPTPKFGQYSNVKYKGMNLNGEVFDQGTLPLQLGISQVVPGFAEGVSELNKGEKARIYIPSILAYGQQGSPPKIQPNEILIFELEVLDISDKQPEQQPQQQQPSQQPNENKKQK